MRWSYLLPRLFIVGLIWAFFAFAADPLLRYSAVETLQAITGAKVDIASVETGYFPPTLRVRNVELADRGRPGRNMLQFGELKLNVDGAALLRKSYVIDTAELTNVRFGTDRDDDGQLEVDEVPSEPAAPPWISEKLKDFGDEWLEEMTSQIQDRLDPNTLESYRVGNEIYVKWDSRFDDINRQIHDAKVELEKLKKAMDDAKSGDTLQQIQNYLQLAQRADVLFRDTRAIAMSFRETVPAEVRSDFARLDQAQKNDRTMVAQTIRVLKPDPRRISESLLGEEMYLQLHQVLSWLETLKGYQRELRQPPAPERFRGQDVEFEFYNPTPRLLCRRMLATGELKLSDSPTPFHAEVRDVTSDPRLLGRPAVMNVATSGETPIRLLVLHDATGDVAVTRFASDFTDQRAQTISAGKPGGNRLTGNLSNMHWTAKLAIKKDSISGKVDIRSDFGDASVTAENRLASSLAKLAEKSLSSISTVSASMVISGTLRKPQVDVSSDLGQQVATGFQSAYSAFVPQVRQELLTVLDAEVDRRKTELNQKLGGRFQGILTDQNQLLRNVTNARQLLADLKSGRANPDSVFKAVSQSGVLSERDQAKADKYRNTADEVLKGINAPDQAIQNALPKLQQKLFRKLRRK